MAKRGRNLAALAALGALGYMATRNKSPVRAKDEDEREGTTLAAAAASPAAASPAAMDADLARETARAGRGPVASLPGRATAAPARSKIPAREDTTSLARETARAGRGPIASGYQNPQRGPAFSDIEGMRAEQATTDRLNDLTREMNRGQRGKIATPGYQNPQRGPSMADIQQKDEEDRINALRASGGMRAKGGAIKMASGGSTGGASRRGDGIAQRGKTKGRMV